VLATAQTFTLREALTMACRAGLVGQAVHQLCEQHRYTVAVHVGGAAPSPDTHARKGGDERDGRASDSSDSYRFIWSVAACGSAISGEASCNAEG
jgi:hypothetical protein